MTTPRAFSAACVAATVLFLAANATTARAARNSVARQLLQSVDTAPQIEVLALGNSLIRAGFDPAAFRAAAADPQAPPFAFNAGLGFTGAVQHLQIARRAMQTHGVRILVYGVFDFMLTAPVRMAPDELWGNKAVSFHTEPDVAARHLFETTYERAIFHMVRRVPMYVERGTIWAKVERLRRALGSQGLPQSAGSGPRRVADFTGLQAETAEHFAVIAQTAVQERTPLATPLAELFTESRTRGIATFVVEMPMTSSHRARFYSLREWQAYLAHVEAELGRHGVTLIRAADWIADDRFGDALHLDERGAAEFSSRLAATMQHGR